MKCPSNMYTVITKREEDFYLRFLRVFALRRKPSLTRHALRPLKSACRAQGPTLSQFPEREQKSPSIVVAIHGNSEAVSQGKTNCTEQKMPRHERLYAISAVLFYFVSP